MNFLIGQVTSLELVTRNETLCWGANETDPKGVREYGHFEDSSHLLPSCFCAWGVSIHTPYGIQFLAVALFHGIWPGF